MTNRYHTAVILALCFLLGTATMVAAQDYGARLGTVKRGGRVSFEPTGPGEERHDGQSVPDRFS